MKISNKDHIQIHASAVEIAGNGVLILGESRSGKSTLVLELISRGHSLVADDAVLVRKESGGRLIVGPHDSIAGLVSTRESGIIDVSAVFGTGVCISQTVVQMCFELFESGDLSGGNCGVKSLASFLGVRLPAFRMLRSGAAETASFIELQIRGTCGDELACAP